MSAEFMRMLENMQGRTSRTLDDMKDSNDQLSGMDGMELRGWAFQNPTVPSRDLTDPVGQTLLSAFNGEFDAVENYVNTMISGLGGTDEARTTLRNDLYEKRWGPTRTPIYAVLLPAVHMLPKKDLLGVVRFLAQDIKVPVEGKDVLGCTAMYWAISTKPYVQPEFAQILFDAGGSVNTRSRFNATAASEIAQADLNQDTTKNVRMMEWYVEHGGDVDVKDTDGMSVKTLVEMMRNKVPRMTEVIKTGRGPRNERQCTTCGRSPSGDKNFAACAKCKKARYCSQECQRVDWKTHKKTCKVIAVSGAASGIGLATAELLYPKGVKLSLADIQKEALDAAIQDIISTSMTDSCNVLNTVTDVRSPSQVGTNICINLNSTFYALRAQLKAMSDGGGSIINTASVAGLHSRFSGANNTTSKNGVIGLTKSAATELGSVGTRVNDVAPGAIDTSLSREFIEEAMKATSFVQALSLRRLGEADEVAELFAWLLNEESSCVTGAVDFIDGRLIA